MATDYISRETAIEVLCGHCQDIDYGEDEDTCWCMKKDRLNQIPAADVRPVVRGKWLPTRDDNKKECSKCHVIQLIAQYPAGRADWCPNCGADMREVEP